jgi:hypothetical protein
MDPTEFPQQPLEETLTFTIKKSTRNIFLAKTIILLGLTLLGGYFFTQNAYQKYERGHELTKEEYLEEFDAYKGNLLNAKQYENPLFSTFIVLIMVSFFIGSYELTALGIGFIIGKFPRQ